MESRAKLLGHPVHQMLIVLPLGTFTTAVFFDLVYLMTSNGRWADISFWLIAVGVITGLTAAVFGLIDFLAIPNGTRAKRIGLLHGVGNVIVVLLFVVSWFIRQPQPTFPGVFPIVLSIAAVLLALVTGWLGGELVDRLGVGVDDNVSLNAPSSITHSARSPG